MQRLSGLDAAFLALETPAAHMHVVGVAVVDPATAPAGFSYATICRLLDARVHLVPAFRHRLVEVPLGLSVPMWIEDPHFDLSYHLRRSALPAPGGMRELAEFVSDVAGRPLDRRKPLWEAYVVEGLEDGHQAFVAKLHHSLIDGASGVEILATLFDLDATTPAEPTEPPGDWTPDRVPSELEMLGRAAATVVAQPARVLRAATGLGRSLLRVARRDTSTPIHVTLPLATPRLSMNRTITPQRAVALVSVPLSDVKAVKNALGVTVNDVVLAVTAGALRNYLQARDELPDQALVAAVPTSVRSEGDHEHGNRVSAMFAALPVEIADPVGRVRSIQESTAGAKSVHEMVGGSTLQEWAELAAPVLFSRAIRAYARLRIGERIRPVVNVIVSNVPGPPFPLYLAGARLVALHPLGPIFDDCGLNVTVISYLDHVEFGFIACQDLVPDLEALADAVPAALAELTKAASLAAPD